MYRPYLREHPDKCDRNNKLLYELIKESDTNSVFIGDFNFGGINWNSLTSDTDDKLFLETVQDMFITQHVDFPTHRCGNTLDLALSLNSSLVSDIKQIGYLGSSDHVMLLATLSVPSKLQDSKEEVPD